MSLVGRLLRRRGRSAVSDADELGVEAQVEGERAESAVHRSPSLQARLGNALAVGLMGALAVGLLGWYYVHSLHRRTSARETAQSSAQAHAKGEMSLPPLGRVDPPKVTGPPMVEKLLGSAPEEPSRSRVASGPPMYGSPSYINEAPPAHAPENQRFERQLAGRAFAGPEDRTRKTIGNNPQGVSTPATNGANPADGELENLLRPSVTAAVSASVLPTQQLLLPKGAFLDCTLETAIDSSLSGMTTCILATDAFSADGGVVLLERGTKLVGETRGQVRAGAARIFVLWSEARTPTGVVMPLASPGTDELGRSGLPGAVNRHFFERFGAALLISVIDGAVQAAVQSQREGDGTVIVNPSGSNQVMTEVLKSTLGVPPTVVKPQGDRIQVLVARDLDFRSVYELRAVTR